MTDNTSAKDLRSLLKSVETAGWDYARIELDGLTIVVSKDADPSIETVSPPAVAVASAQEIIAVPAALVSSIQVKAPIESPSMSVDALTFEDVTTVGSPSIGLFWRSPKPGAPHFIEVGQEVSADDTVCIIEVMKLMTHVKAGHDGTIARIHPSNGDMVEYGTPLVDIAPTQ
jgi:acetyl-CoA carboxylase biotin carboxyl carrier protein